MLIFNWLSLSPTRLVRCRFLPVLASGAGWSPRAHATLLPAFRQAARALLLVSERYRSNEGVELPAEVLLHVLRLAAVPVHAWLPGQARIDQHARRRGKVGSKSELAGEAAAADGCCWGRRPPCTLPASLLTT